MFSSDWDNDHFRFGGFDSQNNGSLVKNDQPKPTLLPYPSRKKPTKNIIKWLVKIKDMSFYFTPDRQSSQLADVHLIKFIYGI